MCARRRDWEPGIRVRRKLTQKEQSADIQSPSSLIRSRSNSHSGKKEPKSGDGGGGGNGSVVQDSGFSTETSSSKETHSASSTTGGNGGAGGGGGGSGSGSSGHHLLPNGGSLAHAVVNAPHPAHRLPGTETEDELWDLLDVIHRKSQRLRSEVDHLQSLDHPTSYRKRPPPPLPGSNSNIPSMFQKQLDRLSKEDVQILRKERDRLLEKLVEMETATLADRIKTSQLGNEVETLQLVKRDLEEQLKVAQSQKLELNQRINAMASTTVRYIRLRFDLLLSPSLSHLLPPLLFLSFFLTLLSLPLPFLFPLSHLLQLYHFLHSATFHIQPFFSNSRPEILSTPSATLTGPGETFPPNFN